MRILISGEFLDYQMELARGLNSKGIETEVILLADKIPDEIEDLYSDLNYRLLMKPKDILKPDNFSILRNFKMQISKIDPDIVHMQLGGTLIDLFLQISLRKYPLVSTFHDVILHKGERSYIREVVRHFVRSSSREIIVHGKFLKEQMIEVYGIRPDIIHNVHIGEHEVRPFKKFEKEDAITEGHSILFFGRIHEYKGLDILLKAQPIINDEIPDARFIIAGGGQDISSYSQYMADPNRFEIHNHRISYKQGAELFQKSSLVVLPYIEASQSGVIPTAYGFRKPVIATSVGSIPEVIDDGVTGILIPPRDPDKLAAAVVKLLLDENSRRMMGENAFSKLKNDFSWDDIVEKTIKIYEKAME